MAYYIDLFSPETYDAFSESDRTVSGFRPRHRNMAQRIKPGDRLVCYMTKLSRWVGVLEVLDGPYNDSTPRFYEVDDPFSVRFHVRPLVWLPRDKTVPIHEPSVWNNLSFTRDLAPNSIAWTGKVRGSLTMLDDADGVFLEQLLTTQVERPALYAVRDEDFDKLKTHRVQRVDKEVTVTVPDDTEEEAPTDHTAVRDSIRIQALLAGDRCAHGHVNLGTSQ